MSPGFAKAASLTMSNGSCKSVPTLPLESATTFLDPMSREKVNPVAPCTATKVTLQGKGIRCKDFSEALETITFSFVDVAAIVMLSSIIWGCIVNRLSFAGSFVSEPIKFGVKDMDPVPFVLQLLS